MQNKAYLFSKKSNPFFENFLKRYNFVFVDLEKAKIIKDCVWVFFGKDCDIEDLSEFIKETETISSPVNFYLPHYLKNFIIKKNDKKFFYPLNIFDFEKFVFNYELYQKHEYQDIIIKSNNMVVNKNKNLSVHFTEKEIDLLKKLIDSKKIKKQTIKTEILNFNFLLDTRSLESHLSRIRKKLMSIESTISIISEKDDYISIG